MKESRRFEEELLKKIEEEKSPPAPSVKKARRKSRLPVRTNNRLGLKVSGKEYYRFPDDKNGEAEEPAGWDDDVTYSPPSSQLPASPVQGEEQPPISTQTESTCPPARILHSVEEPPVVSMPDNAEASTDSSTPSESSLLLLDDDDEIPQATTLPKPRPKLTPTRRSFS